jgi:hypothetical protein
MAESTGTFARLRQEHPVFFWGTLGIVLLMLAASVAVGARVPRYQRDAGLLDRQMNEQERATRDQILQARSQRATLAVALLRRELRLKALEQKELHLAIDTDASTLALRHGGATLREIHLEIGPDSTIHGPDGRTWRFVRALGERTVAARLSDSDAPIPEWVYVGRGEPVPPADQRRIPNGTPHYILRLDDGTEIYSRPESGPFAQGAKPGSFAATEEDLGAIFDAVGPDTPVYIF